MRLSSLCVAAVLLLSSITTLAQHSSGGGGGSAASSSGGGGGGSHGGSSGGSSLSSSSSSGASHSSGGGSSSSAHSSSGSHSTDRARIVRRHPHCTPTQARPIPILCIPSASPITFGPGQKLPKRRASSHSCGIPSGGQNQSRNPPNSSPVCGAPSVSKARARFVPWDKPASAERVREPLPSTTTLAVIALREKSGMAVHACSKLVFSMTALDSG